MYESAAELQNACYALSITTAQPLDCAVDNAMRYAMCVSMQRELFRQAVRFVICCTFTNEYIIEYLLLFSYCLVVISFAFLYSCAKRRACPLIFYWGRVALSMRSFVLLRTRFLLCSLIYVVVEQVVISFPFNRFVYLLLVLRMCLYSVAVCAPPPCALPLSTLANRATTTRRAARRARHGTARSFLCTFVRLALAVFRLLGALFAVALRSLLVLNFCLVRVCLLTRLFP